MSILLSGKILALFISKVGISQRAPETKVFLDKNGIINDKFHDKDVTRSVLITSSQSYDLAKEYGINMPYGSLGENLLIDYNPYKLASGSKLHIGDVILQISQNCTICNHLSSIDERLPKLLQHDRGIFAQVIQGGIIKKDDKIYLEEKLS